MRSSSMVPFNRTRQLGSAEQVRIAGTHARRSRCGSTSASVSGNHDVRKPVIASAQKGQRSFVTCSGVMVGP